MNKLLIFIIGVFSNAIVYAQEIELKNWQFHSEKDTVEKLVETPHTWNLLDAFDDTPGYWRGTGYYTTQTTITNLTKSYYLHFNGVNQVAKIKVNNREAVTHKGGYTAFDVDITPYIIKGNNTITVEVDNRHDEKIPPLDADFTFFGGIYRTVYLVEENATHFKKNNGAEVIKIDALLDDNWQGTLNINGSISNPKKTPYQLKLSLLNASNEIVVESENTVTSNFKISSELKEPLLWSPDAPNLYIVELQLFDQDKLLDTYRHKIGFRRFEVSTSGFKLNGQPIKLIGVNRHQDWEGFGNAVPIKKQLEDLVMIKDMGSNFLRLAHYPQDKSIYKAADSLGLILWSEIPVINKVPIGADYAPYKKNSIQMQEEHIAQNYNHPSFIFVGYMNEIFIRMVFDKPSEEEKPQIIANSLDLAKTLEKLTREEAPNHITVMALHGNQIYNDTKIADIPMVIGWNLYYGWYEGQTDDLGGFLDNEFKKYPNRPLIISEYGVGADTRLHNSKPKKFDFSEEYQFKYHPGYYQQVTDRPFVVGMAAWNFADFSSEFRGDALPHINQKGLVNYDRTPKNIYYWYKGILKPEEKESRFFRGLSTHISNDSNKEIMIISNQDILLQVNKNKPIYLEPTNGLITYSVNLKEGRNTFKLMNEKVELQDSLSLKYYKPDFSKTDELAINFGTESYFLDSNNQIWIPANQTVNLKIFGDVVNQKSSTNIRNTINDPLYQSSLTNINKLHFDVPKGIYEITLLFSKLKKEPKQVYELNRKENEINQSDQSNSLIINDNQVSLKELDLFNKQDITLSVNAENGITIETINNQVFSICGILIKKK